MKLIIVGQPSCRPCVAMKNQVLDRVEELEALGASFEYIDLNSLDDKETFIEKHKLSSTPTIWIEKDGEKVKEITGYIDLDTLFDYVGECK